MAADGNADAQHYLAYAHFYGEGGLRQDYAEALKWCRSPAEHGHAGCQHLLAIMYNNRTASTDTNTKIAYPAKMPRPMIRSVKVA